MYNRSTVLFPSPVLNNTNVHVVDMKKLKECINVVGMDAKKLMEH